MGALVCLLVVLLGLPCVSTAMSMSGPTGPGGGGGGGDVFVSGAPSSGQVTIWADPTHVQGVSLLPVTAGGVGAAPTAGDQVFVSDSATAGTWRLLPDCPDTAGQHLNYDIATNAWICGTTGGGSPLFSVLQSGTNTTAAMVVGTGASLIPTGTGSILATALVTDPPDCAAPLFARTISSTGTLGCAQVGFGDLTGMATDLQIPDLSTLETALTPLRCVQTDAAGKLTVATDLCGTDSGVPSITFGDIGGTATDAQIPPLNTLDTGLTPSRCVETDAAGTLVSAGTLCGTGGGGSSFSALTGGTNTTATMMIGTGASLGVTGTGSITATALATDPPDCAAPLFARTIGPTGALGCAQADFAELTGLATDAQIPTLNTLETGLIPNRCVQTDGTGKFTVAAELCGSGGGPGVTDGDKQDITVSASGAAWILDPDTVTYAKLQNTSAASVLLGRGAAAGAGDPQEITLGANCTMTGTVLNCTGGPGGGDVVVSGTPTANQIAIWVDDSTIAGTSALSFNVTDFDVSAATRTRPNKVGTTPPATCSVGDTFFDSDATVSQKLLACETAPSGWAPVGGVGGGGTVTISGTPAAGQLAAWANSNTIEGVSTLNINHAAASVAVAGTVTTSTEYVTTGAGGVTRTLPAAASGTSTRRFTVLKVDSGAGALTVAPAGADTINGSATPLSTTTQWAGFEVQESAANGWVAQPIASTAAAGVSFPLIGTSNANPCFAVGAGGATNPAFQVDCSAATAVTGLQVVSAATGTATILQVTGTAASEALTIQSKSAGNLRLSVPGGTGVMQIQIGGTNKVSVSTNGQAVGLVSAQTIADTNTIAAEVCGGVKRVTSAGAVTTNTTNTFTNPGSTLVGCKMSVRNVGANNITLDSNALFKTLGATDVVLTPGAAIDVFSDGAAWYQLTAILVAN